MAGVSASTLRLWETQGLVEPHRTPSGQRLYSGEQVEQLRRISWLRRERGLNPSAIAERLRQDEGGEEPPRLPSAKPTAAAPGVAIGTRVRRLRQAAQQTLEDVARATQIPSSALSTFERTSVGLSFKAVHDLAAHFGTTVSRLSGQEDDEGRESLVRAGGWKTWPPTSPGVLVQALANGRIAMECHRFELDPGASSEGTYQHEGEEFIHVLSGSLEVVLGGDRFFVLNAGDSFYFESQRPHAWRNASPEKTILIWINTPPTF